MNNIEETTAAKQVDENNEQLTMQYILQSIDKIINDYAHIHEAISAIKEMSVFVGEKDESRDRSTGDAISQTVQARETTNQQMIKLLEKMYDDLKPQKEIVSEDIVKLQQLADVLNSKLNPAIAANILQKSVQQMFVKPGALVVG
jgi:hypothetical protein